MVDFEAAWRTLRLECTKLRALSHLIEHEDTQGAEPLDQQDIRWGIGMLLNHSIKKIRRVAIELEDDGLEKGKRE